MTQELHALFKGKVQGVGFRWTVLAHAERLNIVGTVQNLPNGTVKVIAQGAKPKLDEFIESIYNHPEAAIIDVIEKSFKIATASYEDFKIIT